MKKFCVASLAIAAMLGAGCNKSNSAAKNDTAGTSGRVAENVSMGDRDFVKDVTKMNAAELDLARLAADRGSTPDVKKFAQMLVDDHTAAGAKLSGVAQQNSIEAPAEPGDSHKDLHEKLAGKAGLDFDKDFIDAMVDDHGKLVDKLESRIDRETLSKYKSTAESAVSDKKAEVDVKAQTVLPEKSDDPVTQRINAWAADTYPVAYAHLQSAKALKDTLKKRATD
jgi:putative membrane protein